MSIKVALRHLTSYKYDRAIEVSPQIIRLRPAPHTRTRVSAYSLQISPSKHFINWQQDPFGNYLARIVFPEKIDHFRIDVELIAEMVVINPFDFFVEEYAEHFPFEYDPLVKQQLASYLEAVDQGPLFDQLCVDARAMISDDQKSINYLVDLNQLIHNRIKYNIRMEPGVQSPESTLSLGSGSCRDFAWLFVQLLRHLGLAARFVSGYLIQLKPDQKSLDGPSGPSEDFTDLHAWTEVYIPGAGWIGLDSTSALFAGEGHIPLACTPDYQSAAPISGTAENCKTAFEFENKVTRLEEKPRVTKPYSDEEWQEIIRVGELVDADLRKNDVRITMGGEPTFVSIDNVDAPEWNSAADGPHKRSLANDLLMRLRDHFGNGSLIQVGQGKWYPGEPLPRWKLTCLWRKDGKPIWNNPGLFADLSRHYAYSSEKGKTFLHKLTGFLKIDPDLILPAFEDPFYFAWEESKLPVNVDPLDLDLSKSLERKKLVEVLQHGMDTPVAFVLPLEWNDAGNVWMSCAWQFRRGELFLIPGNSPAGLRLPLDSIQHFKAPATEIPAEKSPFAEHQPLVAKEKLNEFPAEVESSTSSRIFKTALIAEVRDGRLHVFLPPVPYLESFLHLVDCLEQTATELELKIIIEGYDPPSDNRVNKFMITPDPGVIEVNIHPAGSWQELIRNYGVLYEEARAARLSTEKFYLDGRHTGTGGANHVTIGGATPAESPLLRRPDLLKSMITYWQHHPSLSYLFSTQFIGPTSQAPRVDEGRDEMLYELELAFQQIPDRSENEMPFWMVDRIFRNLLVDVTGNTHRAEFCIDKLYSPDSQSGRLGILEFRGFEMPPHFQMCMVQFLLIRSLISRFWREPYDHRLVRWGTALHDKYLLPHYCYRDMTEVVEDLNRAGYPISLKWFEPFFSFRFPFLGELQVDDIHVELHMAIEPWHVLGEEVASSGTARFVDSSLERIQVKISGLTESRYQLLCNGYRVPLKSTGVQGEYVTGIRYKAWKPPSSLHPTIDVDTPLVIDLYDTWSKKSIAACQYHVAHPGGRNYQTFPVNSYEAESRRISRFFDYGHSIEITEPSYQTTSVAGRFVTRTLVSSELKGDVIEFSQEYPNTMDLRMLHKKKK
ncbi:MAG: transglutaminase family protein [Saprospiraceae bacterium]|nr:transglutaminase family protein [Saprospiraceae bacterium]